MPRDTDPDADAGNGGGGAESTVGDDGAMSSDGFEGEERAGSGDRARGESTVSNDANAVAYDDADDGAMSSDGFEGEEYDGPGAGGGSGAGASSLLWFSVAGAVIMGALWLADALGATEFFLPDMVTLGIAALAAVGAVLTWYGMGDDGDAAA